jgi:hypothetical protein
MRTDRIVVAPPLFDHDLCFPQRVEDLSVKQLIAQLVSVTPRTRATSAPVCPCASNTSAWRSFATISSAECFFRGMFSLLQIDIASLPLAPSKGGRSVRRAYMHTAEFWSERVDMMQAWADYLGELRVGADVLSPNTSLTAQR